MKRILYQMISLLLTICLCGTLAGCGDRDVGGIGKISMEDSDSSSGGLNPLGEPNQPAPEQTPAPQDPQTPAPQDSQTPAPADTPAESTSFATEEYNDGKISMMIPVDWNVDFYYVDEVTWGVQVTDPQNPDRMLIYHSAMTPFFVSEESRQVWANRVNARYANAPVAPNPSAGTMLGLWQILIDYMKLEGAPVALPTLQNISLQSDDKVSGPYASYGGIESQAVATCTGSGGSDCVIVLSNAFIMVDVPIMDNIAPNYYTAYGNYAVLLPADQLDVNLKAMVDCVTSVKLLNQENESSFSASDGSEYPLKAPEFNTDITME